MNAPEARPKTQNSQEAVLQETQQLILAILNAVPARIFWKDENSVYLGCNAPFARDAGFDRPEELIGKNDYQMGWRDQAELYRADDRQVIQSGHSKLLISEPQTTPDGNVITLLTSKVPLRDSKGKVYGVLGTYLDVTEHARLEEKLSFSNLLHRTAMENSPDAILAVDDNKKTISFNAKFATLWNVPLQLLEIGDNKPVLQTIAAHFANPEEYIARVTYLYEHPDEEAYDELRLKDGRVIERHTAPLQDTKRKYLGRIWYFRDITAREHARETIATQNIRFDAALNNMVQGLLMFDGAGKLVVCNRRYAELFAVPWEQFRTSALGLSVPEVIQLRYDLNKDVKETNTAEIIAAVQDMLARRRQSSVVAQRTDGHAIFAFFSPMVDRGFVATFEDITEIRRHQDMISHMAHYDALTDLPNRGSFYEKTEELLRCGPQNAHFAVFSLDLDRFKSVNDTLGHPIGDKLLQAAAGRMRSCVRGADLVARLGGDEFAILQVTFDKPADISTLASRLIEAVSAPYQLEGHQVMVGTSIGIAVAPGDGTDSDQLIKNADLALYRCKADGGNVYRFFEPEMDARMRRRSALELDLRKAIVNDELTLNYQPVVNIKTGKVTTCEALIRWHHAERGWVSPSDFIPIAEETNLIVPIGEWVLKRACADAARWPGGVTVAVNVSPVQFKSAEFVHVVATALEESALPARRLELEITELALMQDNESVLALLHRIKELGVSIAMDDFGTGYSSLGYLRSFPFDRIKVDRSFIRDLSNDKDSLAILRAVVGLGRSLGIVTTAEGVETRDQLAILKTEGCTDAQGYLFSAPRSATELSELLTSMGSQAAAVA